jgi:uncharacterized protein YggU (UPF0235/DUF167 family)
MIKSQILEIKVKPNSSQSKLECTETGEWVAFVRARPIDGKANAELIALVSDHFGIPKRNVSIKTGTTARLKRVELDME